MQMPGSRLAEIQFMSRSLTVCHIRHGIMDYDTDNIDDLYSEDEKYFDYVDQLGSIQAKTLVIVGDQDWIFPPG